MKSTFRMSARAERRFEENFNQSVSLLHSLLASGCVGGPQDIAISCIFTDLLPKLNVKSFSYPLCHTYKNPWKNWAKLLVDRPSSVIKRQCQAQIKPEPFYINSGICIYLSDKRACTVCKDTRWKTRRRSTPSLTNSATSIVDVEFLHLNVKFPLCQH